MKKFKITLFTLILIFAFSSVAYGADIYKGSKSEIDASNAVDGYIKVRYLNETTKKLKVIIENNSIQYTYNLNNKGEYDTYPLQLGDGKYKVRVFENISDNRYATTQTVDIDVKLKDENAPYLISSQMVNYTEESETVKKAQELAANKTNDLEKVEAIYDYVISNIKYDNDKAKNVKSDYLPDVDEILKENKGICYDYSSLLAAMLRSNSIPTKLVTGYSQNVSAFHAWNEVYTEETGWIALDKLYFDGKEWRLMDSTIASSAKQSNSTQTMEHTNKLIDRQYYTKKFEY
ncbi:transglutaminase domain-containing protein [Sedimentibacter hydroxybenzoicus DSM 7310]|uniref:Transglutaminase domain-containing protein n=1 Tax=Sedimentibacter hydroxybenzoicus DSM 7310 TaxID=1123245 RepID=A0A974BJ69_SEDHY|nr:transglutaminase-like domain-containing protein [Sedimentibacter hydroxybenzoicus]NYB73841.1 transglutaminase domain-containing protein [Sedimentibacter hydroxybenzoicus DSM 7310]